MKDKLYKAVHWIGRAVEGLRPDEGPKEGLVSDSVVSISLRDLDELQGKTLAEFKKTHSLSNIFDNHFIVHSLDGETGQKISRAEMMRVWAIFTLYMGEIVFPMWEGDPRGKLIESVLQLVTAVMGLNLLDDIKDLLGCDDCKKKDECPAGRRNKEECDRDENMRFN